jgi:hypothetical protein
MRNALDLTPARSPLREFPGRVWLFFRRDPLEFFIESERALSCDWILIASCQHTYEDEVCDLSRTGTGQRGAACRHVQPQASNERTSLDQTPAREYVV